MTNKKKNSKIVSKDYEITLEDIMTKKEHNDFLQKQFFDKLKSGEIELTETLTWDGLPKKERNIILFNKFLAGEITLKQAGEISLEAR